ncbi:homeodomain-interacting protein kinase 4-like [Anguilla anguilla]|uniref:homeodomain-interacting protein kinase 4-like n=1 Tax=Anguilla anguilla TaxID=7936 RepID=UPI0015AAA595|nr:homeodomain-interacting protein kinase 4-like [Anguilla anguilla]XP_035285471.1 homeodomain-interacting protein kinase 4-like [Anguilla anguilla]
MISSESEQYDYTDDLGYGMFGTVATYERQSDKKIVAVKKLFRAGNRMAIREARLLSALMAHNAYKHHIIRFYEGFSHDFFFYIVEEALEQNLNKYRKTNALKKFEIRDIRTIMLQLLIALAKLEDMGIVHTDIKQDNILLVNQGRQPFRVKLADFGSAMTANELAKMWTPYIQPRFVRAPEVLLACPCDPKIDMWSLGCVMGEMAIGRMVFPSLCELDLAHSIFGTRGMPSAAMLSSGIKTKKFFDRVETSKGVYGWQLKPYNGRQLFSGTQSLRGYAPANLDLLRNMEELEHGSEVQDFAELADRRSLVDLLNRMLVLEPEKRVGPNQALRHPFLTLKHLSGRAKPRAQYSLQGYREAGVCPPQDRAWNCDSSSEESDPEVPKKKRRRSLRRSLRSFFSRVFSRRRKRQPAASQVNVDPPEGPSSAARGGQPAQNPVTTEQQSPEASSSSSAFESEESSTEDSGGAPAVPEGPPKKRGFLKWLRTRFSEWRGKKSASSPGSDSSL